MSGRALLPTGVALALALGACSGSERESRREEARATASQAEEAAAQPQVSVDAAAVPEWLRQVAGIANAVERRPTAADSILRASGMGRAVFDSLLYEIAASPELTRAYEALRVK